MSPPVSLLLVNVCASSDILQSHVFDFIGKSLLRVDVAHLSVFTDGSLSGLRTLNMKAGAAAYFKDVDLGLGVKVSGLVSSTIVELQAIALALECVLPSCSVNLFSDSQTALNACRSESSLFRPNFRNQCWVEHYHIVNIICQKNLDVNWVKVKRHSGVLDNKQADGFAKAAALLDWRLPHLVNEHFLKTGDTVVFGNFRHFVCDIFWSVLCACWKVGFGSQVVTNCFHADIDWSRLFLVWHPDFHLAAGFTSLRTTDICSYFIKALHCQLPVAVHKHLYNKYYPSVLCLFCGDVEVLDHVFFCLFDADDQACLINAYASA
ncbi:hypothetical protein G9A89_021473 [Geosiphon pyriformis]|nr:hypothetical protein G9A89_021473 [Geosiphon pyriformis]